MRISQSVLLCQIFIEAHMIRTISTDIKHFGKNILLSLSQGYKTGRYSTQQDPRLLLESRLSILQHSGKYNRMVTILRYSRASTSQIHQGVVLLLYTARDLVEKT